MPNGVKATALAIIPKHKNATAISEYRPIASCNVIYKIIAKVLAERLKPVMNLIVKDNQAGFVKSRVSTDNILLANEILCFAGKRRNYNTFCAKLDIKKVFDSVSRKFLLDRLAQKGFLHNAQWGSRRFFLFLCWTSSGMPSQSLFILHSHGCFFKPIGE
ncbi:integrator complex subunit 11 [Dendrobium catenatum]|uniref:Integrator complex subunit 11 n=1 Tax=Dendrobium catenatum TaxID=906689 RepID=A0A2I0XEB2_9ASPA|nr:integrator complex subunit 11 [Dendrobium catenatum]